MAIALSATLLISICSAYSAQATTIDSNLKKIKTECSRSAATGSNRNAILNKQTDVPKSILYNYTSGNFTCGQYINDLTELCATKQPNGSNALQYLINKKKQDAKGYAWASATIKYATNNCADFSTAYGQLGVNKPLTQSSSKCGTVSGNFKDPATGVTWGADSSHKLYKCGTWVPFAFSPKGDAISTWYGDTTNYMIYDAHEENNWVVCWASGALNPATKNNTNSGQNRNNIWYYTLGDRTSKWGWLPATVTMTGGQYEFPADVPNCYGVPNAKFTIW